MKLLSVCTLLLAATFLPTTSFGQTGGTGNIDALLAAHRYADARLAALNRVRSQPGDAAACLGLARAVSGLGTPAARDEAVPLLQNCTEQAPRLPAAHYALGLTLGEQMLDKGAAGGLGALSALRSAPRMRDALRSALDIEPGYFAARNLLVLFYAAAPAMVGGGSDKATAAVTEIATSYPQQAHILRAQIAMAQQRWADAERELAAYKATDNAAYGADVRHGLQQAWLALAYHFTKEGEAARGKAIFERLAAELPGEAEPQHGLGRALHELGDYDGAIAAYQQAAKLQGAARQPTDYRVGISLQSKAAKDADKDSTAAAIAAFERFLAIPPNRHLRKSTYEDAKRRSAALRGGG